MSTGSVAVRTSNLTITEASAEIRTTATQRATVREISLVQVTGTAQSLGLGRPAARGVTPANATTFLRDELAAAMETTVNLTWGTSPTVPAAFMRRWNSAATIGVGVIWTFPRGLVIPVSASLVVWNVTTALACDLNVVLDE